MKAMVMGAALLGTFVASKVLAEDLFVASYNVENLFDTDDDPAVVGDEDYTPTSPKAWTQQRMNTKLANLAKVIKKMNSNAGPDVLGLCEVENRNVVTALVASLSPLGRSYQIVHKDSPSNRGIDCALIYDGNKLSLKDQKFHFVDAGHTRDILEATFEQGNDRLTVFMNHWPSQNNPAADRAKAAQTLRQRLDQILQSDPQADIVALGDLNDHPSDASVKTELKTSDNPQTATGGAFYNSMWPVHLNPNPGTYVFDNKWEVIDHVILSPGLLDNYRFRWKAGSTGPVRFDFMLFQPAGGLIARPNRTYSDNDFHADGISDHLPVACIIQH